MFRASLARRRGLIGFASGILVAGAVVGAGAAIAAIPSTTTSSYTACVNKSTGAVRVIDYQAGKRCTSKEKTVSWAQGYRYRGAWAAGVTYAAQDVVTTNGSSYVAKLASKGKAPATATSYWGLLAAAGAAGPKGDTGAPGSARAYALVSHTGAVSRAVGSVTVTHADLGMFCVAVAGISSATSIAVVAPDYGDDYTVPTTDKPGSTAIAEWDSSRYGCPPDTFAVATLVSDATGVSYDDSGFVFMVP